MHRRIALAMIATVLVVGCAPTAADGDPGEADEMPDSTSDEEVEPDSDGAGPAVESTDTASAATVTIGDFFFAPDGLAVQEGDTVTWTHDGDITHNVTARDGSFASQNLASGETFVHTFLEAGSFEYRCTLHGQMLATIDVS